MRLTFSRNPFDRLSCWLENEIFTPISRYYYTHKKAHCKCCVCGYITAPYFDEKYKWSPTYDMGWHKFKDGKWSRYVCHHCADHGYSYVSWDEWQQDVKESNERLLNTIKNKDPEYYRYWFEGGCEQELFGEEEEYNEKD